MILTQDCQTPEPAFPSLCCVVAVLADLSEYTIIFCACFFFFFCKAYNKHKHIVISKVVELIKKNKNFHSQACLTDPTNIKGTISSDYPATQVTVIAAKSYILWDYSPHL